MPMRFVILSRVKDEETREMLEMKDEWVEHLTYTCPNRAVDDLVWLTSKSSMREYFLYAKPSKKPPVSLKAQGLDDNLPF